MQRTDTTDQWVKLGTEAPIVVVVVDLDFDGDGNVNLADLSLTPS